jgi:hypothetical protein
MITRVQISAAAVASLLVSSPAFAAAQVGETSGPAAGQHVVPTTVIQKIYEHRSSSAKQLAPAALEDSGASAGFPGIEGKPDTQSGRASRRPSM